MPFVIPTLMEADKPDEHTLRVGVFGLIMPMLDQMCGIDVYAAYGMTETVIHATNGRPDDRLPERSMGTSRPATSSWSSTATPARCAPKARPASSGCGERAASSCSSSTSTTPRRTRRRSTGDWFKTGDMVLLGEGGNLFYRERDKDLLKVGGENVSAREVEDVIRQVPGVDDLAVVAKSHEMLDMVPVAFVVRGAFAEGTDDELGARHHRALQGQPVELQGATRGVLPRRAARGDAWQGGQEPSPRVSPTNSPSCRDRGRRCTRMR